MFNDGAYCRKDDKKVYELNFFKFIESKNKKH